MKRLPVTRGQVRAVVKRAAPVQLEIPGTPVPDRPRWAELRDGGEPSRARARARRWAKIARSLEVR